MELYDKFLLLFSFDFFFFLLIVIIRNIFVSDFKSLNTCVALLVSSEKEEESHALQEPKSLNPLISMTFTSSYLDTKLEASRSST
ncbi:unnamed protein product [Citrullus colocynthis]|uniref:Uncharacterized protein n=1 Tax=Citrullus colocynthis TaxID=252529 RepID=A0ABP0XXJ0_9ROSI